MLRLVGVVHIFNYIEKTRWLDPNQLNFSKECKLVQMIPNFKIYPLKKYRPLTWRIKIHHSEEQAFQTSNTRVHRLSLEPLNTPS